VFEVRLASYGKLLTTYDVVLKGNVDRADLTVTTGTTVFSDAKITEYDATVVDAYPVTVTFNGTDLTITGDNTTLQTLSANQLYDVVSLYLANNYDKRLTPIVDINGTEIDGTFWDINITLDFIRFTNPWEIYATEADRNISTNLIASGTSANIFRFNYVAGTTYYMWVAGTKQLTTPVQGSNSFDLGTSALLVGINNKLGFVAVFYLYNASYINNIAKRIKNKISCRNIIGIGSKRSRLWRL